MFLSRSLRSDVFFEFCHNFPEFVRSGRISFEVFFFLSALIIQFLNCEQEPTAVLDKVERSMNGEFLTPRVLL